MILSIVKYRKTNLSLQERLHTVEQINKSLVEDAKVQKMRIEQFEEDLAKAKIEKEQMQASYQSKIEVNCFKMTGIVV